MKELKEVPLVINDNFLEASVLEFQKNFVER